MRKLRLIAAISFAALTGIFVSGSGANNGQLNNFGRLFPNLPGFTDPHNQQLANLAQTMLDPKDPANDNTNVPSGFTYFGQFLDHDLTLDTLPQPTQPVDPRTLTNNRTFKLDLDSMYGGGPSVSPQLYADDGKHLLVQVPDPSPDPLKTGQSIDDNGVFDLPRNPDGSAILIEHRNDENEIISQIHTAFILASNRLVDEGNSLEQTQRILTQNYQWAVVHDYLQHILVPGAADPRNLFNPFRNPLLGRLLTHNFTPVEFSVAAFRFGHSQVRDAYDLNEDVCAQPDPDPSCNPPTDPNSPNKIPVFVDGVHDLSGGRPLPGNRQIAWQNFFTELVPAGGDSDGINISRKIDTLISDSLFKLPIPGAEATGSNVLAFRNMLRAVKYGLPSGQSVARELHQRVISPESLNLGRGFQRGTPLWYYILAESQRGGGTHLGPVGSAIVAASFADAILRDRNSYVYNPRFRVNSEIAGSDGNLTVSDFFVFAGVATQP